MRSNLQYKKKHMHEMREIDQAHSTPVLVLMPSTNMAKVKGGSSTAAWGVREGGWRMGACQIKCTLED
jgi:hypothetical protein